MITDNTLDYMTGYDIKVWMAMELAETALI
jgi:hypothetical protein